MEQDERPACAADAERQSFIDHLLWLPQDEDDEELPPLRTIPRDMDL